GDHDVSGGDFLTQPLLQQIEAGAVRVDERRAGGEDVDGVSEELGGREGDFILGDLIHPEQQGAHRYGLPCRGGSAVETAFPIAGQAEGRLAQRLARYRARVDADAADDGFLVDNRDPLVELRRLDGRTMAGGTGADDKQVVVEQACTLGRPCNERV